MNEYCNEIISKAFRTIPGIDYNKILDEYLEETSDSCPRELFYELALTDEISWEYFRDRSYPLFARYLNSRSINPENPSGVVLAAFYKDQCYLLEARDFVDLFAKMEGLDSSGLHSKFKQWLAGE
jgi:hypothetical protein